MNILPHNVPVIQNVIGVDNFYKNPFLEIKMAITLENVDGFSKFKIWPTAKKEESITNIVKRTFTQKILKIILLKAHINILIASRTVYKRVTS